MKADTTAVAFRGRWHVVIWIGLGVAAAIGVARWASLPWLWSTIDDAGYAMAWRDASTELGPVGAAWEIFWGHMESGPEWGLFRPSFWLYAASAYSLPPAWLHVLRLLMFLAATLAPLIAFRRQGLRTSCLAMAALLTLASGSLLSNGLFFLSIPELAGAALVALGLAARQESLRIAAWVGAAWFKSPFAWILIAEAVVLWRQGRRAYALASLSLGAGTLVLAGLFARTGSYSAKYGLDPWRILTNASKLVEVWTALVLVMVLWWLVATRSHLEFNSLSFVLLFAFVGYTAQMLPWAVSGYYLGPIVYLFGLFLASMLTIPDPLPLWRWAVALVGPAVIAMYVLYQPIAQGLEMNKILNDVNDCLLSNGPGDYSVFGQFDYVTTEEGVLRMVQNAQLTDPQWAGTLTLAGPSANSAPGDPLCSAGAISLHRP